MTVYVFSQGFNKLPSGGVKVLFDIVKTLSENGITSKLLIPGGNFNVDWFDNEIEIENNGDNLQKNDIVILHEETLWAWDKIAAKNCKIAILNQGAHWSLTNYLGYEKTKEIYKKALFVAVNSYYTKELADRLFDINSTVITLPVDNNLFKPSSKQNRISYMPRRNSETAECIAQYVKGKHTDWEVYAIDNLKHRDVALVLSTSKIFLSFGGPEGFGLPPLEAALSGCYVIGYHGFGGQEFFYKPLFEPVAFMEVIPFLDAVDKAVIDYKNTSPLESSRECLDQYNMLKNIYNENNFNNNILKLIKGVL